MKTTAISCKAVTLKDGFWKSRQILNRDVTTAAVYDRFDKTGRIAAFNCTWKEGDDPQFRPHIFWDSDVAKWIEGAAYILMHDDIPSLQEKIDALVDCIEKNMTDDGYFNVAYNIFGLSERFTRRGDHELYCAGHHIEAACAYFEATGKDKYLNLMKRFADLIYKVFVDESSASFATSGHPEIELALIRLYRTTNERKYLKLCSHFIEQRGNNQKDKYEDKKIFCDYPLRTLSTAEGHCVRMNYLLSGACDLAYETDDKELFEACRRVFDNITSKRMYITGSQGSTYRGERYTTDYHLPNKSAYAETCASISLGMFAHRMALSQTDSKYADIVERTLFNGTLSGVSLDGDSFFYENPLELRDEDYALNYGAHTPPRTRPHIFGCSCCPPNIVRVMAMLGGYIYSMSSDTIFVHQFISSSLCLDGISVELDTQFPKNGKIRLHASGKKRLAVRIPYYSKNFSANAEFVVENNYAFFDLEQNPDIEIDLCLVPRFVYANTHVYDNIGKAAVMYGPVVYCAEAVDNPSLRSFFADTAAEIKLGEDFYGVPCIELSGENRIVDDGLYCENPPICTPARLKLVPYFGFANRGESEMITYIPIK